MIANKIPYVSPETKYCEKKIYQIGPSQSLSITPPNAYLVSFYGWGGALMGCYFGAGYGATDARHKITPILASSTVSVTPSSSAYGVVITNNNTGSGTTIYVSVVDLM